MSKIKVKTVNYTGKVTPCQECLLKIGVASKEVQLQKGFAIWNELRDDLLKQEMCEEDRLDLFAKIVRLKPNYQQKCLKMWLEYDYKMTSGCETFSYLEEKAQDERTQLLEAYLKVIS